MGRLAVLSALGMIPFSSGTGWAATVSMSQGGEQVNYVAAAGESNALVLIFDALSMSVRVSDPGATISVGTGCVLDGADAICQLDNDSDDFWEPWVELGDGDDSADLSEAGYVVAKGGAGNDQIVGGQEDSIIEGGPGNDHLTSHGGMDYLTGGEGDDQIFLGAQSDQGEGGPGNDTVNGGPGWDGLEGDLDASSGSGKDILIGGPGHDAVLAVGRYLRVTPTALVGQGNDTLVGVEKAMLSGDNGDNVINARAWRGETLLLGFRGNDLIVGGSGNDFVFAGGGNDVVRGRSGRDELAGGGGADVLFSRDFLRDRVVGGPGRDRARVDRLDTTSLIERFF